MPFWAYVFSNDRKIRRQGSSLKSFIFLVAMVPVRNFAI
jgi:hypothetical protein